MDPRAPHPEPRASEQRIALFGGSFNPPHLGHVLCAVYAHAIGEVDAVWVLPVWNHPWVKDLAPWDARWAMCRAAFDGLGFVELRDDERDNPQGRTFDLVAHLRAANPGTRFALIGGTDTREDLRRWYRGEELAEQVELIAIPRRGWDDEHPAALPAISSTAVRERLAAGQDADDLLPAAVARIIRERGLYR